MRTIALLIVTLIAIVTTTGCTEKTQAQIQASRDAYPKFYQDVDHGDIILSADESNNENIYFVAGWQEGELYVMMVQNVMATNNRYVQVFKPKDINQSTRLARKNTLDWLEVRSGLLDQAIRVPQMAK